MKQNQFIPIALVAIVAAGAGFYGGMKYRQQARMNTIGNFANRLPANGTTRSGFRPVSGEIIKADDTSITVKLSDGGSKIILLSGATNITKAEKKGKSDLVTGKHVAVFGTENTDGSVTAQNIQLNP